MLYANTLRPKFPGQVAMGGIPTSGLPDPGVGFAYVVDDAGNYVVDDSGNYFITEG